MPTRRKFLAFLGIGIVAPSFLVRSDAPETKRSRWNLLFANPDTAEAKETPNPATWNNDTITAAWIGQSTVLINFFGTWILTDPVFSERIGIRIFGATIGPKRLVYPALSMSNLPKLDLILLSHAHMDHLDVPSLEQLHPDVPVIIAKNCGDVLDDMQFRSVRELDWGEKATVKDLQIEALRVKHFGWRYPWESDRSKGNWDGRSYNAYLLSKNGKHIVFGGDTSMQEFFRPIGERGLEIELAIMPIGAYDPWIHNHCNPEQAVAMARHMGAKRVLPIHWGTFIQSDEPANEPIERFHRAIAASGYSPTLSSHGETWSMGKSIS